MIEAIKKTTSAVRPDPCVSMTIVGFGLGTPFARYFILSYVIYDDDTTIDVYLQQEL